MGLTTPIQFNSGRYLNKKMFSGAAAAASQLMFGAIQRMSRAYSESDEKGEKEKKVGQKTRNKDELGPKDIQFPVKELRKTPLTTRAGWMREIDVFRYVAEPEDEEGCQEIFLETWSIGRHVHNKVMEVGQLYRVRINWDLATLTLNLVGVKDEVPLSLMPSLIETGAGPAYIIRNRDFHTYRMFGKGRCMEGPAMGARLLFLSVMDLDLHQCTTIGDFEQWPVDSVLRLFEDHVPGESFRRPEAWEAGLTTIRRLGSDPVRMDDDLWMDGNDTATSDSGSLSDLGQSPDLSSTREERRSEEIRTPRVEDKELSGQQLMAVTRAMEESRNAPPPAPTYMSSKVFEVRFGPDQIPSGSVPGGWKLSYQDWLDIKEMRLDGAGRLREDQRSSSSESGSGTSVSTHLSLLDSSAESAREEMNGNEDMRMADASANSSESVWSPRAELSYANHSGMSSVSREILMMSPEDVMRGVIREHEEDEARGGVKRKRSSSASTTSMSSLGVGSVESMVFSPFLAKPGGNIVNVSSDSSAVVDSPGRRGSSGQNASPVFNFAVSAIGQRFYPGQWGASRWGWGGMPQGNMMAPVDVSRAMPVPCPEGVVPLYYADDMGVNRMGGEARFEEVRDYDQNLEEMPLTEESEGGENNAQDDVFNISQVD